MRSFGSSIGKTCRCAAAQVPLQRKIPLLRVTKRLVRDARPYAVSEQIIYARWEWPRAGESPVGNGFATVAPIGGQENSRCLSLIA